MTDPMMTDPLDEDNKADRIDGDGDWWVWCDECDGFRQGHYCGEHRPGLGWTAVKINKQYGPLTLAPRSTEPPTTAPQPDPERTTNMTDRIDHAAEARRAMTQTLNYSETDENTGALVSIAAAQVHATLALVEQQRIANLIALRVAEAHGDIWFDADQMMIENPDIAAALGVETGADDE